MTKKAENKKVATVDSVDTSNELLDRVAKLEATVKTLVNGLEWAGKQIEPCFGLTLVGKALAEVARKAK